MAGEKDLENATNELFSKDNKLLLQSLMKINESLQDSLKSLLSEQLQEQIKTNEFLQDLLGKQDDLIDKQDDIIDKLNDIKEKL